MSDLSRARAPGRSHGDGAGWLAGRFPGESNLVGVRQGVPPGKVADAVTAFSSTEGGVILLGVDNAGRAVGNVVAR